jgi:hypothetical protein
MSDMTHDLLIRGMAAAQEGDEEETRHYLEWMLGLDPPIEEKLQALYWLSEVSQDPDEKRECLEDILAHDIGNARARRSLAILNGDIDASEVIDPDRYKQTIPASPVEPGSERFTCPNCGGKMVFTPDGQSLTCEYCASRENLTAEKAAGKSVQESSFIAALATAKGHAHPIAMQFLNCKGCGAGFILPPQRITVTCPHCESTHTVENLETREIAQPDGIIPYQITEKLARQALIEWFDQQSFQTRPRVARGRSLYLPGWTFDVGGQIGWKYTIESDNNTEVRTGENIIHIDDIIVLATDKVPASLIDFTAQYDLSALENFDPRFLANWIAETYQISMADASLDARKIALDQQRKRLKHQVPNQAANLSVDSSKMLVESYRLILLPVWLSFFILEDQKYHLLINGQTGQVHAELPQKGFKGWLKDLFSTN